MERTAWEVSWSSLWKILIFLLLVTIMFLGRQILIGLFLAIVISSGLDVLVDFLERRGIPRTLGVILIFFLAILLVVLVLYTIIPFAIADLKLIFINVSESSGNIWLKSLLSLPTSQSLTSVINRFSQQIFSGEASPFGVFSAAVGNIGLALAVFISSFYLSLSKDGIERFIKAVFMGENQETALRIYDRSRRKIGTWVRTQAVLSVVVGFLVWGALLVLGVRHAFLIGVLAAVFEIVPFVGPILAGAVAVLSAFTVSTVLAAYTLIAFLAIQQLESHVLVPLVTKRSVGLHPVIVIIAILIGIEVDGVLGALIAIPAAAVFQEVLEDWSSTRKPKRISG